MKTRTMLPPAFTAPVAKIPALDSVAGYAAIVLELERGAREDARDTVRPAGRVSQ